MRAVHQLFQVGFAGIWRDMAGQSGTKWHIPAQAAAALDNAGDGRASPQGLARGIDECAPTHPACRGPLALAPHSATMARAAHAVHRTMVQGVEWGGPLAGGVCGLAGAEEIAMSKGDELIQSLKEFWPTPRATVLGSSTRPRAHEGRLDTQAWQVAPPTKLLIERQQLGERVFLGNLCVPPIGRRNGGVECSVSVGEPLRAGVVEIGERAPLEFLGRSVIAGNRPLRIAGDGLVHPFHPLRRVEPAVAQLHQPPRGLRRWRWHAGRRHRRRRECRGRGRPGRGRSRRWSSAL